MRRRGFEIETDMDAYQLHKFLDAYTRSWPDYLTVYYSKVTINKEEIKLFTVESTPVEYRLLERVCHIIMELDESYHEAVERALCGFYEYCLRFYEEEWVIDDRSDDIFPQPGQIFERGSDRLVVLSSFRDKETEEDEGLDEPFITFDYINDKGEVFQDEYFDADEYKFISDQLKVHNAIHHNDFTRKA